MLDTVTLLLLIPVLVTYANITVPVIPDPEYLQSLDLPSGNDNDGSSAIPADLVSVAGVLGTAGLGYFLKKQGDRSNIRGSKIADVMSKFASNDRLTDEDVKEVVYGQSVMVDILCSDPVWKAKFEAYHTKYGKSAFKFFEDLPSIYEQSFDSFYNKTETTVTCKDPVVDTLNKVEQKVTPTP